MRKLTNLRSAFVVAAFVAAGVVAFDASLLAAGPDGGKPVISCALLDEAEVIVLAMPDGKMKERALDKIAAKRAELGCDAPQ